MSSRWSLGTDHRCVEPTTAAGVLLLAAFVITGAASAVTTSASAQVVCHLSDQRIDEASGIGVGIRSDGVDYVENDSGDVNRFFALNARTCTTAAIVTVPQAVDVDWEDLQVAPDASGTPSVWIADIGDNRATRSEVRIYRVPEPRIDPGWSDRAVTSAPPVVWRLRYPDGPRDAESLAVTPNGRAYIVSKNVLGVSNVYAVPTRPDAARVQELAKIATIDFTAQKGRSPVGSLGSVLATSAAMSRNGQLLAVRTYVYADVWRLPPDAGTRAVAAALHAAPRRVALPAQQQGERIAFDGDRLLVDSEGVGTAISSVALPADLTRIASAPVTSASRTTSSAPASSASSPRPSPSPRRSPVTDARHRRFGPGSVVVLLVLIAGVVLLSRRARRLSGGRGRN